MAGSGSNGGPTLTGYGGNGGTSGAGGAAGAGGGVAARPGGPPNQPRKTADFVLEDNIAPMPLSTPELRRIWEQIQRDGDCFRGPGYLELLDRGPTVIARFGKGAGMTLLHIGAEPGLWLADLYETGKSLMTGRPRPGGHSMLGKGLEGIANAPNSDERTIRIIRFVGNIATFGGLHLAESFGETWHNGRWEDFGETAGGVVAGWAVVGAVMRLPAPQPSAVPPKVPAPRQAAQQPGIFRQDVTGPSPTFQIEVGPGIQPKLGPPQLAPRTTTGQSGTTAQIRSPNCFSPTTLVATEQGLRQIQTIEPGERVYGFDFVSGEWRLATVECRHDRDYTGPIFDLNFGGCSVQVTKGHPFWVLEGKDLAVRPRMEELYEGEDEGQALPGRWIASEDLRVGDVVYLLTGKHQRIASIKQWQEVTKVCNLTVPELHTFAVGEVSVLVHNVSSAGTATVRTESIPGQRVPHVTIEIEFGGIKLHTEQVIIGGPNKPTTIMEVQRPQIVVNEGQISLPNARGAQIYQESMLGAVGGAYNAATNSCVTHVALVLGAGGIQMPTTTVAAIAALRRLIGGP